MAEVRNAVDQTSREIEQRFDFKGSKTEIELDAAKNTISVLTDDDFKLKNVVDVLQTKMVKRGVSLRFLDYGKVEPAAGGMVRQHISLKQGITKENAKKIIDAVKTLKLKVQSQIQEEQVRVSGKDKDELQKVIEHMRQQDFGIELQYTNYR